MRLIRPAIFLGLVLGAASVPVIAGAAEPASGTVGPDNRKFTWQGQRFAPGSTHDPEYCPPERDPEGMLCDHFSLTVDVDPAYWETRDGGVWVGITWPGPPDADATEFDLYVYQEGRLVGSSALTSITLNAPPGWQRPAVDRVLIARASGTYEVRVLPFFVEDASYTGSATFVSGPPRRPGSLRQAYHGVRIAGENPEKEPVSTPSQYGGPPLTLQAADVGTNAGEPTIGIDPEGRAFYLAWGKEGLPRSRSRLFRSTDGGATWQDASPQVQATGASVHQMSNDPFLYVETETGRVFQLDLVAGFAQTAEQPRRTSMLSVSDDGGESYETFLAYDLRGRDDRQSLTSGAVPAGVPLATVDPDFDEIVYYCANHLTSSSCSRSLDGGRTFAPTGDAPFAGVNTETGSLCGGITGDVQTDGEGRVLVPRGFCDGAATENQILMLAVSEDAGQTWQRSVVSENVRGEDSLTQVAADAAGNLYYVWTDQIHRLPYLATSTDHGQTWSAPLMIAPPGVHEVTFANIVAGDPGRIAVTFPGTTVADPSDLTRRWNSYVAISTNALDEDPLFVSATANPPRDPIHRGNCPPFKCAGMVDFLDIQLSPFDGSVWTAAVDTCTQIARCNTKRNPGFDGTTVGAALDSRGIAIRQLSGPWLIRQKAPSATYSIMDSPWKSGSKRSSGRTRS